MTNRWNRLVYRFWAPVYDWLFDRLLFARARRRALALLALQPGERVLLVGVGTGADLPLLPAGVHATGLDLSPEMLAQAQSKSGQHQPQALLIQADALRLPLGAHVFDAAVLNLILSVVPDGQACWQEAQRALRPGGRAVIFDKFLPDEASPGLGRRLANLGARLLGTDLNRRFGDMVDYRRCRLVHAEPSLFGGAYRIILIQK